MNFIEMLKLIQEALAVFSSLKESGTLDKLLAAEQAIEHELQGDSRLKHLFEKLGALAHHAK